MKLGSLEFNAGDRTLVDSENSCFGVSGCALVSSILKVKLPMQRQVKGLAGCQFLVDEPFFGFGASFLIVKASVSHGLHFQSFLYPSHFTSRFLHLRHVGLPSSHLSRFALHVTQPATVSLGEGQGLGKQETAEGTTCSTLGLLGFLHAVSVRSCLARCRKDSPRLGRHDDLR